MTSLYSAAYASPLGAIVLESDGACLTALRFTDDANIASAAPVEYAARRVPKELRSNRVPYMHGCPDEATPIPHEALLPVLTQTIHWLDDYFAGKKPRVIPRLNPRGTDFQKRVWQALFTIDYGQTKTYGEIAKMLGCRSAQAVGQALTRNPIAIIIPCHRVIAAHGKIGGYGFGVELKQQLLQMESQVILKS